jgi:hypothetical protein
MAINAQPLEKVKVRKSPYIEVLKFNYLRCQLPVGLS